MSRLSALGVSAQQKRALPSSQGNIGNPVVLQLPQHAPAAASSEAPVAASSAAPVAASNDAPAKASNVARDAASTFAVPVASGDDAPAAASSDAPPTLSSAPAQPLAQPEQPPAQLGQVQRPASSASSSLLYFRELTTFADKRWQATNQIAKCRKARQLVEDLKAAHQAVEGPQVGVAVHQHSCLLSCELCAQQKVPHVGETICSLAWSGAAQQCGIPLQTTSNLLQAWDWSKPPPWQRQFQDALLELVGQDLLNEFTLLHHTAPVKELAQAQVQTRCHDHGHTRWLLAFAVQQHLRPYMSLLLDIA